MKQTAGEANLMVLSFIGTLLMLAGGHSHLVFADLKTGPEDGTTLAALAACFGFGCGAQLSYLMAGSEKDKGHSWQRWVGEILLGGVAAYLACELWI